MNIPCEKYSKRIRILGKDYRINNKCICGHKETCIKAIDNMKIREASTNQIFLLPWSNAFSKEVVAIMTDEELNTLTVKDLREIVYSLVYWCGGMWEIIHEHIRYQIDQKTNGIIPVLVSKEIVKGENEHE